MKWWRLYAAVLPCVFLHGCHDDSYRGRGELNTGVDDPIPVLVAIGDPSGNISRGTGAIDDSGSLVGKQVFVYAFNRNMGTDYRTTSAQDNDMCLVDGSLDSPSGVFHGKSAEVGSTDAYVKWEKPEQALYWPSGSKYTYAYDFFAYYLDDIVPSGVNRSEDCVSLDVRIDGSQDIMASNAILEASQLSGFTESEKLKIQSYSYSYYTAQRNIVPVFKMSHELVKLNFDVKPGLTMGESKELTVTSITVVSLDNAEFVVAHKNKERLGMHFSGSAEKLSLTEEKGQPLSPYVFVTRHDSSVPERKLRIGGSLLVAPDTRYTAYITISEKRNDGTAIEAENKIDIIFDDGFVAGSQYNIALTISGYLNVYTEVSLEKWGEGGEISLDGDTP